MMDEAKGVRVADGTMEAVGRVFFVFRPGPNALYPPGKPLYYGIARAYEVDSDGDDDDGDHHCHDHDHDHE